MDVIIKYEGIMQEYCWQREFTLSYTYLVSCLNNFALKIFWFLYYLFIYCQEANSNFLVFLAGNYITLFFIIST